MMIFKYIFWTWLLFTVVYGGFGMILFLLQSKFLYCPLRKVSYTPEDLSLDYEDLTLTTSDEVKINAWYIPADNAQYTVLFCHGNGGNMMHRLDSIELFNKLGLNCLIFDYRGYGKSHGNPTEQGTYNDALTCYKWLTDEKQIDSSNIIIFGRSLGGSIAAQLASQVDCGSLVLESTFTSYLAMAQNYYWYMPVKFFVRYAYKTIDCIQKVNCPVLVIHSPDDEVVPYKFGRQLYEVAGEPKEFVEISGGHNDGFLTSGQTYKNAWTNWINWLIERKKKSEHHRA